VAGLAELPAIPRLFAGGLFLRNDDFRLLAAKLSYNHSELASGSRGYELVRRSTQQVKSESTRLFYS